VKSARKFRLAGAAVALLAIAIGLAWIAWPPRLPPGVSPEVARLVSQLGARPGLHQRLAGRLATLSPALARRLPDFLRTDALERRRLEACHRLLALGSGTRAATPRLTGTFLDGLRGSGYTISLYAFLTLLSSGLPAGELLAQARQNPQGEERTVRFCASLLNTEDEQLREYAWACLEAAGEATRLAETRLRDLATEGDPVLRQRAHRLLASLDGAKQAPGSITMGSQP
jgi:hypothetical protein